MRSALPLGHKLIALILAVAVAGGLFVELRRRATESANSAALSFDPVAARQINAGILHAAEPAVVLSQSILTDSVVAQLLTQEGLAPSANSLTIGEFRARLDLTQPSPGILWVRYRDADPSRATTATNAVAETLAAWMPSGTAAGTPSSATPAAPSRPGGDQAGRNPVAGRPRQARRATGAGAGAHSGAGTKNPAAASSPAALQGLAAALGGLQDQLAAAQGRAGQPGTGYSPADGEHQRYLEGQFRAVGQKLNDLRAQYATGDPAAARSLAAIREALVSGWSESGRSAGLTDFHTAGTSAAQLNREREQLADLIGVVAEQRRAVERRVAQVQETQGQETQGQESQVQETQGQESQGQQGDRAEAVVETPLPAPGSAAASEAGPIQGQPAGSTTQNSATQNSTTQNTPTQNAMAQRPPAQAAPASGAALGTAPSVVHPFTGEDNPLRLVRLAGPSETVPWWPAAAAGCLCGLIYLAAMGSRYRSAEERLNLTAAASVQPGYRMITPTEAATNGTRDFPMETASAAAAASNKRASFRFEPDAPPVPAARPKAAAAAPADARVSMEVVPEAVPSAPKPLLEDTAAPAAGAPGAGAELSGAENAGAAEAGSAGAEPGGTEPAGAELTGSELVGARPGAADPPALFHENIVQIADPWADELRKALSQTTLGRMLDDSGNEERRASDPGRENQRPPQSGRLAG